MFVLFSMALPLLSGDFEWNLKMPVYFICFCFKIWNAKYQNIFLPDTFFCYSYRISCLSSCTPATSATPSKSSRSSAIGASAYSRSLSTCTMPRRTCRCFLAMRRLEELMVFRRRCLFWSTSTTRALRRGRCPLRGLLCCRHGSHWRSWCPDLSFWWIGFRII